MSAKVDEVIVVEPHNIKMSATSASSGASTSGPKTSIFAAKSGFVIPKNKLSGSLVPIFRGGKRLGGNDPANEDGINLVQRKTKWGPDLTQDAAVRRGRALAYQTRVDQIEQQLNSAFLEPEENDISGGGNQHADPNPSSPQNDIKNTELLELERREAIGEILRLNPSYKAPPDYKPLLKEARVPIPVKEYPGYNFVGLIFGPGCESQKRLEKETGAKIQLYGTKANTEDKVEISPLDGNDAQVVYEELNVHVSADTFEKVDAAVDLIELLITSVSGNLTAGANANVLSQSQEASTPMVSAAVNQGVQPAVGTMQNPHQDQFQYQGSWFQAVTAQAPVHPPSAFIPSHTTSDPSAMPSLFGPGPLLPSGLNPILQNPSLLPARSQPPMQVLPNPYLPRNFSMPPTQLSSSLTSMVSSLPFTSGHPPPARPSPVARPLMPSLPPPLSSFSIPQPDLSLTPTGSSGWFVASAGVPASLVTGNVRQTAPPMVPLQGSHPLVPQPRFPSSAPPSNMSVADMVSPGPPNSQLSSYPKNHLTATNFASVPPRPIQSTPIVTDIASIPNHSLNTVLGSAPISLPMTSTSQLPLQPGIIGSFSGPTTNFPQPSPKPQYSSPGDFIFQSHQLQNPGPQMGPKMSSQLATQNTLHPRPMMQLPEPQAASFRPPLLNSASQSGMHMFPRPPVGNQMDQSQSHMNAVPAGNPTGMAIPPRLPTLHMGSRNFSPTPQSPNLAGPFPPRPMNPLQFQQDYPASVGPRGSFMAPNQQFNRTLSLGGQTSNPGQQVYDPFSPTSLPIRPQKQGSNVGNGRRQENDPEYDDLMASVGVK